MIKDEIKDKANLNLKKKNQKNEDQIQNKYKLKDTIEFVKALHVYRGLGERKEGEEEKDQSSSNRRADNKTCHPKRCVVAFHVKVSW